MSLSGIVTIIRLNSGMKTDPQVVFGKTVVAIEPGNEAHEHASEAPANSGKQDHDDSGHIGLVFHGGWICLNSRAIASPLPSRRWRVEGR